MLVIQTDKAFDTLEVSAIILVLVIQVVFQTHIHMQACMHSCTEHTHTHTHTGSRTHTYPYGGRHIHNTHTYRGRHTCATHTRMYTHTYWYY